MKKSMVLAAVAALVLTACGKKADEATPETTTANEAVATVTENATAVAAPVVEAAKDAAAKAPKAE